MQKNYQTHKKILLLLLIFSCVFTYLHHNVIVVYALYAQNGMAAGLTGDDITMLGGVFAPLISIGGSPFIALTMLSGLGSLLNSGTITADTPLAGLLTELPIAQTGVFITLLVITGVKFLLSLLTVSKVFCDATLGKLESLTGTVCMVGGAFLLTSVTAYAATTATANIAGASGHVLTTLTTFLVAVLAYAAYYVIRTMVFAVDVLAFLFSPIPGLTGFFVVLKHVLIGLYTWFAMVSPATANVVGIILVVVACLVFRWAKRLELYYRRIYLIPFTNSILLKREIPLLPKKLPLGAGEFSNVELCLECFFMNKNSAFYKRERCYFIRAAGVNYLFKRRIFGKTIKLELPSEVYVEKPFIFRFLRIFTDEQLHASKRQINLVVRREHSKNLTEIITAAKLIDYRQPKTQQAKKGIKRLFGSF
ncbi:MAG: hypothetical protein FWG63_04620 [Defluviitaleaceae bacterium]|nr:hypothetical protein [Defluviitaleaceae bacterium]